MSGLIKFLGVCVYGGGVFFDFINYHASLLKYRYEFCLGQKV
jgi:hypothetical protein